MSHRRRFVGGLLLVALLASLGSCQFLQNEFFFLDAARPPAPPDAVDPATQ
ncbi:MAG: hypothetical protein AAF628_27665 [Planctomycetota bacterium]